MKRKRKLKRYHYYTISITVLLIAVSALGYIKRQGIKYHVNSWRASGLLKDSLKSSEINEWKEAERLALAAWQLDDGNYKVVKQLYQSSMQQRSRYALAASKILFTHPEATTEDKIDVLGLYLNIGDIVTFKAMFGELSSDQQMLPDAMSLGVRFLYNRNDIPRALTLVDELLKSRGNSEDKLLAAKVLSKANDTSGKAQANAQRFIDELFQANEDPGFALAAFELLKEIPPKFWHLERFSDCESRLTAISEKQAVTSSSYLLAKEVKVHQFPENRESVLEQTTSEWKKKDPAALCEWLLRLGESARILKLSDEIDPRSNNSLFRIVTLAAITEKDWRQSESLLNDPHPQMRPSIVLGLQAAIAEQQGQIAKSRSLWQQAISQAELTSGQVALLEVAKLASRTGNADVRNRAVTEALKRPSAINLPASDVAFLFEALAEKDEVEDLLAISRNLLSSDPENPVLINNVVWLELVLEEQRQDYSGLLLGLVEKFPDIHSLRSTLGLSLLTNGKPAEAVAMMAPTFGNADTKQEASSATDIAVGSLAFASNGDREQAKELKEQIVWSEMMEIEQLFFKKAIERAMNPEPKQKTDGAGN